jgi:hypothetical protein
VSCFLSLIPLQAAQKTVRIAKQRRAKMGRSSVGMSAGAG